MEGRHLPRWARGLLRNPEYPIMLAAAVAVVILSLADVIQNVKILIAVTLGVLSVMAFSALRQSETRDSQTEQMAQLANSITELITALSGSQTIAEIPSGHIQNEGFDPVHDSSSSWRFRGCMGSYLRRETLPRMAAHARNHATSRSLVRAQILDPASELTCQEYATYRRQLEERRASSSSASWTADRVRLECLASLLASTWFMQHENLQVEIGVRDRISTLRYDVADTVALITNEDGEFPAIAIRESSRIYYAIKADLDLSFENSRKIDLNSTPPLPHAWSDITDQQLHDCMVAWQTEFRPTADDRRKLLDLAFGGPGRAVLSN